MRFLCVTLFILFNIYLIESANRTESGNSEQVLESEISENVPGGADEKSDNLDDVFYELYEYDDGNRENSVLGKSEKKKENSAETSDSAEGFPNEVFLTLRNITADAATAFRSFTNRNDVVDLQASASDNLNVTSNDSFGNSESAGINLRALRDAGHPPQLIEENLGAVHLPYKHTKIDTADLSDCALQGEWKPIGVAHGHLHVESDNSHQAEVLQSVGSYAVPNKVIPHWQQGLGVAGSQGFQDGAYKPSGLYAGGTGGSGYGSSYGYGSISGSGSGSAGFIGAGIGGGNSGTAGHYHGSGGGFSGAGLGQLQKLKSTSMLSPPPMPPIILGKKPGYWKLPKTKHKFFPAKGRRPGFSAGGSYGFSNSVNLGGGSGYAPGYLNHANGGGHSEAILLSNGGGGYGGGGFSFSGSSGHPGHSIGSGGHGVSGGFNGLSNGFKGDAGGLLITGGSSQKFKGGSGGNFLFSGGSSHSGHGHGNGGGSLSVSGSSGHGFGGGSGGTIKISGGSSQSGHGFGSGGGGGGGSLSISGGPGHSYGGGAVGSSNYGGSGYGSGAGGLLITGGSNYDHGEGAEGVLSVSGGSGHGYGSGTGGLLISGNSDYDFGSENRGVGSISGGGHGYGGGNKGSVSVSGGSSGIGQLGHGIGGGPTAGYLISSSQTLSSNSGHVSGGTVEEDLSAEGHSHGGSTDYLSSGGGSGHLISGSTLESGSTDVQPTLLVHGSGHGLPGGSLVSINQGSSIGGNNLLPESAFLSTVNKYPSGGSHHADSTFSSTHISQGVGNGNPLPDASFLSSHINQDFAVHGQGVSDDLSSSTFTCGKNHDHNTNYHTATFQVADHDLSSSLDVLQYGGDSAVFIKAGNPSFHDHTFPERKQYKTSDTEASGSDNRNELTSQAAQLTSHPTEQDSGHSEAEPTKVEDGDEPERHSYYHEITKVTKIPANTVGSVEYTFSKYETKPQTFSMESEPIQEEPEIEQPQIIRELEHLSNKFELDIENPKKLFDEPPSEELAYHYPFQDVENNQEGGEVENFKESVTEFPYKFYHNPNKVVQYPVINIKKPVKYIPLQGKPHFHQKTTVSYHQPKSPAVILRKPKPKVFLKKKQNYEVQEHGGERHRPIGDIFPPQKFPKQFHNPKPNFAVDRPKNGWRPDAYQEYKYDHSHGKKVKKFKTNGKLVGPILIRRPVSPAPIIRVVEVTG